MAVISEVTGMPFVREAYPFIFTGPIKKTTDEDGWSFEKGPRFGSN